MTHVYRAITEIIKLDKRCIFLMSTHFVLEEKLFGDQDACITNIGAVYVARSIVLQDEQPGWVNPTKPRF
jgi:hypothetical protein